MLHLKPGAMRDRKDFLTGLILLAVSGAALYLVQGYRLGRASAMGPGYFPMLVAGLLFLVGIGLVVRGLLSRGTRPERLAWRPLLIIAGAAILFSFTLAPLGFVPATILLVLTSALAGRRFSIVGHGVLAIGLALFCYVIFLRMLALPLSAFGPVFGG